MSTFFLIRSVVPKPGYPFTSCLIHAGRAPRRIRYCATCFDSSRDEPSDFYIRGFSDIPRMASPLYGFLEPGPPLIGARDRIEAFGARFSGVVPVRVGYRDWDQGPELPDVEAFARVPHLGILFVVRRWEGVCQADGSEFPRCRECGGPKLPVDADLSAQLGIRGTPDSDFAVLAGGEQDRTTIVSDHALAILGDAGFGNLSVLELPRFD